MSIISLCTEIAPRVLHFSVFINPWLRCVCVAVCVSMTILVLQGGLQVLEIIIIFQKLLNSGGICVKK